MLFFGDYIFYFLSVGLGINLNNKLDFVTVERKKERKQLGCFVIHVEIIIIIF